MLEFLDKLMLLCLLDQSLEDVYMPQLLVLKSLFSKLYYLTDDGSHNCMITDLFYLQVIQHSQNNRY